MLLSQTVTFFIQFNKKNTYIFQKTTIFIILLPKLKMHISLLYSWWIQTIRSWFLILVIKHNLPDGYTSISFQIREWIHQGETSFFMVTITFTPSTQNMRKKYGISTQSSKPLYVCVKRNTSFQLQLETSATFHVQKMFSIFLWISKKLRLSDNLHKTAVSLGWKNAIFLKQLSKDECIPIWHFISNSIFFPIYTNRFKCNSLADKYMN